MPWIESHQELARHPKARKLARLLGVNVPTVIGHLHLLWWWAVDYAPDGWLGKYTAEDVADAVLWEGDARALWDALLDAGWLDAGAEGAEIHDWDDYGGRLLGQRRKDAERKRQSRGSPPPVGRTSNGHPPDVHSPSGVTVHNSTVQDSTGVAKATMSESDEPSPGDDRVDVVYQHFKIRVQPKSRLCPRKKIAARLKRFSPDELKAGIDHFAEDPWWMENNGSRGAEWFFESDSRSEQFLLMRPRAPNGMNGEPRPRPKPPDAPPEVSPDNPFLKYREAS